MTETEKLRNIVLAPYIIKATALIGIHRGVGGNQFRHALATMAILFDYKLFDNYVLLKAAVIHDLFEDVPGTDEADLRGIDDQANEVVDLVWEVTRPDWMPKNEYLKRILEHGSRNAKLLKCADRISNLTDLHPDTHVPAKINQYLDQTEEYVIPMARQVNPDMVIELTDLVFQRRKFLKIIEELSADF